MITLQQYDGRALYLNEAPQKIVSLVPSITESLILFGKKPVGRTSFCIHPSYEVKTIPVIGGTKTPKISKILELSPDLIIANKEENRSEDVLFLQQSGISVWTTYPTKIAHVIPWMKELVSICGNSDISRSILMECEQFVTQVNVKMNTYCPRVIPLIWKNPWMGVGEDTYINDLVSVAGGINPVAQKAGRYPILTEEEIFELQPEVLLLPSEPYAFNSEDRSYWRNRLGLKCKVEFFVGEDLSWFGPRVVQGLKSLEEMLKQI